MIELSPSAKQIHGWLSTFPTSSLERLKRVNESTSSSSHILLTMSYGLIDSNIRALNRMIIQLLLCRMRAEKSRDESRLKRLEANLEDLHTAIDHITGVDRSQSKKKGGELCKRPNRKAA